MTIRANTKMPPSQRNTFSLSLSARPPNIAGPGLSLTSAFNVKGQPLAELHAEKIDACRLKRAEEQKYIRTTRVVLDESEAAVGIPHFQSSGSHSVLFSLRLRQVDAILEQLQQAPSFAAMDAQILLFTSKGISVPAGVPNFAFGQIAIPRTGSVSFISKGNSGKLNEVKPFPGPA